MLNSGTDIYDIISDLEIELADKIEIKRNTEQLELNERQIILECKNAGMKDVTPIETIFEDMHDLKDEIDALRMVGFVNKFKMYEKEFLEYLKSKNIEF